MSHIMMFEPRSLKGPYQLSIKIDLFKNDCFCSEWHTVFTLNMGPDQMLHSAVSDLGLQFAQAVCRNTWINMNDAEIRPV